MGSARPRTSTTSWSRKGSARTASSGSISRTRAARGAYSGLSPRALATWLARFLPTVSSGKKAVVVGHSFGGVVGLELAAQSPELVAGLVVMGSPALGLGIFEHLVGWAFADKLVAIAARVPLPASAVQSYLRRIWGEPERITAAHVRGYQRAMQGAEAYSGMLEAARHLAKYRLPVEKLRAGAIPCTVLWGERDPVVSVLQGERIALAIGADFEVLARTGHCVPEERPERVLEAIDRVAGRRVKAAK